jgi:hypothetical protein
MAIGPQVLNRNFLEEVEVYEKIIDKILSTRKIANGGIVNIGSPNGMSSTHYHSLRERYIKAGWKDVTWHPDQKDGNYLIFKS